MSNWANIFSSDDYKQLPPMEQFKLLRDHLDGFKDLPLLEQRKFYERTLDKTQFEKERTPSSTGVLHGIGEAAKDVGGMVWSMANTPLSPQDIAFSAAKRGAQAVIEDQELKGEGRGKLYRLLSYGAKAGGIDPTGMEEAARHGDTAGVWGHAAGQAIPVIAGELIHQAGPKIKAMREPGIIEQGRQKLSSGVGAPHAPEAVELGSKPNASEGYKAASDIDKAKLDLAEIERQNPTKGKGADAMMQHVIDGKEYLDRLWKEGVEPAMRRQASELIDNDAAVSEVQAEIDRRRPSISRTSFGTEELRNAEAWLNAQRQPTTVELANNMIRDLNEDLSTPAGQRKSPYTKLDLAVRQQYRNALNRQLEVLMRRPDINEIGVADNIRRYGALNNALSWAADMAERENVSEGRQSMIPRWMNVYTFFHPHPAFGVSLHPREMFQAARPEMYLQGLRKIAGTSQRAPSIRTPVPGPRQQYQGIGPRRTGVPGVPPQYRTQVAGPTRPTGGSRLLPQRAIHTPPSVPPQYATEGTGTITGPQVATHGRRLAGVRGVQTSPTGTGRLLPERASSLHPGLEQPPQPPPSATPKAGPETPPPASGMWEGGGTPNVPWKESEVEAGEPPAKGSWYRTASAEEKAAVKRAAKGEKRLNAWRKSRKFWHNH